MAWKIEPGMQLEAFTEDSFSGWWSVRDSITCQEIGSGDGGLEEQDARLFAAAPALLNMLQILVDRASSEGDNSPEIDDAKKIIAKVREHK